MKHRLLIDASSVIRAAHYAGKDEEFGFKIKNFERQPGKFHDVYVNTAAHGFENFVTSYRATLALTQTQPFQTILVKDGWDSARLRRSIYPEYKGKRDKRPPELNKEYQDLVDGVEDEILSMGGTSVVQNGMEADDVIAYLCQHLEGRKTIWSRDGDMLALRSDSVDVYLKDTVNPDTFDQCPAEYVLLYKALVGDSSDNLPGAHGFGKAAFLNLVLQFGFDGLDQLRGLFENNELHRLVEDVADFKPLQKILDNQQMVYTSYACAKFYPHRVNTAREPLEIKTGRVQEWKEGNHLVLRQFFATEELVTSSNYSRVRAGLSRHFQNSPFVALDIETSPTEEGAAWAKRIDESKTSRKSDTVDVFGAVLTGLSLTYGENLQHTVYFSVDHADTDNCTSEQVKEVVMMIPEEKPIVVHHSAFELPVLYENWGVWLPHVWDTLLMKSYVEEYTQLGLKFCSDKYLGHKQTTYEEVTQGRRMNQIPALEVTSYGCDDTRCTAALFNRFLLTMEIEHTLPAFEMCELTAQYWVAEAFVRGVQVDLDVLKRISAEDDEIWERNWAVVRPYLMDIDWPGATYTPFEMSPAGVKAAFQLITGEKLVTQVRLVEKLAAACAEGGAPEFAELLLEGDTAKIDDYLVQFFEGEPDFSTEKDAHMRELLYDRMKMPIRFRNKPTKVMRAKGVWEGTVSADADAVKHALVLDVVKGSREEEVLNALHEMKAVETRRKLYYRPLPLLVHWKDGRLHPYLGQCKTKTRRFAPNNPNVNQFAKKGEGKKVRDAFPAEEGYVWSSKDWSGQELRLGAERSGDEMLTSCYVGEDKRDPHSLTGAGIAEKKGLEWGDYQMFVANLEHPEVKVLRANGKGVNFSSQYLCQAPKLAKLLVVPTSEAQEFLDAKNAVYWGLAQWQQDTIKKAHTLGYTTTLLGARRHLYEALSSVNKWEVLEAERQGVNFEIQGSGAEMMKLSLNAMWRDPEGPYWKPGGPLQKFGAHIVFPVHDEGDFQIPLDCAAECTMALHAKMIQQYADMQIPLESEVSLGTSFGKLKKVGVNPTIESINKTLQELGYGRETVSHVHVEKYSNGSV